MKEQSLIRRVAAPGLGLVLLAMAQPALAFDAADADALSHFVGDAAQALGEAGEALRELKSGEFADFRGRVARGAVKARWNAATAPLRNSSAALRRSLPYKVAPALFTISDTITSVLAPALEGDYRGAMGNAANLAVAPTASGAGASLFGAIGTGVGATIGSFIPVVGTVAGGMVGGAIGTFAGGFVAASAYDRYVKDNLAGGLEAGIAALFDETPRQQAMDARHASLYDAGADDIRTYWDNLRATGLSPDEIELIGPELSPDIAVPREQPETTPEAPGGTLSGTIEIVVWNPDYPDWRVSEQCRISGEEMLCEGSKSEAHLSMTYSFEGRIDGLTATGNFSQQSVNMGECTLRWSGEFEERYEFNLDGTLRVHVSASRYTPIGGTCAGPISPIAAPAQTLAGTWRNIE